MPSASKRVTKSLFDSQTLEYCREVETSGQELVITDRGRPVLRVIPYGQAEPEHLLSFFRGTLLHYDDPTEPVGVEDWEALG
jgi:antitoxin (DNA-binding transcriptional repressor) of toxin-antitoxin stability system